MNKTPTVEQFIERLKKNNFNIKRNANKLKYLNEALENHQEDEVYTRIIDELLSHFNILKEKIELYESYIKSIDKKLDEIPNNRPVYITELIELGYIAPDGKTAYESLEKITSFLNMKLDSVTSKLLINTFIQTNGKKFSKRTAQDAIARENARAEKRDKTL